MARQSAFLRDMPDPRGDLLLLPEMQVFSYYIYFITTTLF